MIQKDCKNHPENTFRLRYIHVIIYINIFILKIHQAITVSQLELAFIGDRADTPPYEAHPKDEKPHLQEKIDAHMQFVLTTSHWAELEEEKVRAAQIRAERPKLTSLSDNELVAHLR